MKVATHPATEPSEAPIDEPQAATEPAAEEAPELPTRPVREPTRTAKAGLPYLSGLDGLRTVAVLAVLGYHLEVSWLEGGFLGVDVFFVISGYLITALLLREWHSDRRVDVKAFLRRRARRLLPALFTMTGTVMLLGAVGLGNEISRFRDDALATLTYGFNWFQVLGNQSYFETMGRPSPFNHVWSLAVEEQFYLLWPLVFVAGMVWLRRRGMLVAIAGLAGVSIALAAVLANADDPSRVYYGTDTRAFTLLSGAVLAFLWAPWRIRGPMGRRGSARLDVAGFAAFVGLLGYLASQKYYDPGLYPGGLIAVAGLAAVVVAVAAHPASRLGRVLGLGPMRWIGVRSYGIYLWHWPVLVFTRPGVDVPFDGATLLAFRLALVFALVEVSYRYVEQPIRNGALARFVTRYRASNPLRQAELRVRWTVLSSTVTATAVFVLAVALQSPETPTLAAPVSRSTPVAASGTGASDVSPLEIGRLPPSGDVSTVAAALVGVDDSRSGSTAPPAPDEPASPDPAPTTPAPFPAVTGVGDSVMLGAGRPIEALGPEVAVDAVVGRSVGEGIEHLRQMAAEDTLAGVVVVHLGNNGPMREGQFDEIMAAVGAERQALFVNVRVPRRWEGQVNEELHRGVARHANAALVDWRSVSAEPGLLAGDDLHVTVDGAERYAEVVRAAVLELPPATG